MKALKILIFILTLMLTFSACGNNSLKNDDGKFYYVSDATSELNITYHTKDCELLTDKQTMEINPDFISMIGLKRCEKCNPPEVKK